MQLFVIFTNRIGDISDLADLGASNPQHDAGTAKNNPGTLRIASGVVGIDWAIGSDIGIPAPPDRNFYCARDGQQRAELREEAEDADRGEEADGAGGAHETSVFSRLQVRTSKPMCRSTRAMPL